MDGKIWEERYYGINRKLTSATSANLYGATIRGISGLASGLDTDTMIEQMTTGTRIKYHSSFRNVRNFSGRWRLTGILVPS